MVFTSLQSPMMLSVLLNLTSLALFKFSLYHPQFGLIRPQDSTLLISEMRNMNFFVQKMDRICYSMITLTAIVSCHCGTVVTFQDTDTDIWIATKTKVVKHTRLWKLHHEPCIQSQYWCMTWNKKTKNNGRNSKTICPSSKCIQLIMKTQEEPLSIQDINLRSSKVVVPWNIHLYATISLCEINFEPLQDNLTWLSHCHQFRRSPWGWTLYIFPLGRRDLPQELPDSCAACTISQVL